MKKIIFSVICMMTLFVSSCSDMLDVETSREVELPSIGQASDSLFYVLGIMQAVQQAADAYYIQNEMRGDLVDVTVHSDLNLREMANFSATASNKYDSAYVYYRIINNCNYYIANRDTTLYDGTYNVTQSEYATVLAFRAWAYLQLARNYGKVKFVTKPLTSLSDIENDKSEELGIKEIVARLADEGNTALRRYSGLDLPYGNGVIGSDYIRSMCIPVDVILGELYLEAGRYAEAADYYFKYLLKYKMVASDQRSPVELSNMWDLNLPNDFLPESSGQWFSNNFSLISTSTSLDGRITYLPMALNKFKGVTSEIPKLFGFDYYLTSGDEDATPDEKYQAKFMDEQQIVPSSAYKSLANNSLYYYTSRFAGHENEKGALSIGDQRAKARVVQRSNVGGVDTMEYQRLFTYAPQIILYRSSTVWLHLAEAFNRMGYPDAAFAILKDGLTTNLLTDTTYITDGTKELLTGRYPFLIGEGVSIFSGTGGARNYGIHRHGCSDASGIDGVYSLYQMDTEVLRKLDEIESMFEVTSAGSEDSLAVIVNAVEDLLCDEYAMEFAFEGCRYADLMRLARHKNESSPAGYGTNFGGRWLARKLAFKNPVKNLEDEQNWYLPMK